MGHLLYNHKSFLTARALARKLRIPFNRNPDAIRRKGSYPVIRYGCSEGVFRKDTEINSPELIRLCSNSYYFGKWAEENDFYVPIYKKFNYVNERDIPEYPFLLRRLNHMAGRDIIIIRNREDIFRIPMYELDKRYWVPIIPTTYELRVHIVAGEVLRIFKKVKEGAKENGEFIRTSRRGFHYSLRLDETLDERYKKAQELCKNITKKLGLFFGGVDIAWSKEEKRYVIWEINTAPGLNSVTLDLYADKLRRFI